VNETTLTITGNLTADPELRFTPPASRSPTSRRQVISSSRCFLVIFQSAGSPSTEESCFNSAVGAGRTIPGTFPPAVGALFEPAKALMGAFR
jgi:single-stranded DNA-binding protein